MKSMLFSVLLLGCCAVTMSQSFSADSVPVRLKYIQASQMGNSSKIQWSVVCLLDYASFDIQRSTDGISYYSIQKFQADKLRCQSPFEHEDKTANGMRLFYRIRIGDLDGRYSTSKTILVYGREKGFEITAISPTLVTTISYLSVSSASNDQLESIISDQGGKIILQKRYNLQTGNNDLLIDASRLEKGNYFITLINRAGQKKLGRFIKQ